VQIRWGSVERANVFGGQASKSGSNNWVSGASSVVEYLMGISSRVTYERSLGKHIRNLLREILSILSPNRRRSSGRERVPPRVTETCARQAGIRSRGPEQDPEDEATSQRQEGIERRKPKRMILGVNGHPLRIATTTAMENCVITSITKAAMIATLHDEPQFSEMFMAYLLTRNSRIEEDLIDQLFNSSERRLARMLLLLANFGKESSPQPISLNISQETLAEMIGTTRSRVSYFMNKFRKLGLIDYNGRIEVHNSLLSAVLHEKPQLKQDE
jgi:hypothetical protein